MSVKPPSQRPFKKFFCDRPEVFLLPPAAFKIWMYHYAREGADRKSWPTIETLMEKCNLGRKAVYQWRSWLQKNGWLARVGEKRSNRGEFAVPMLMVKRGTIPGRTYVHHDPKSGSRTHPQKGVTDPSPKGSLEVDTEKQVDSVSEKASAAVSGNQMDRELQKVWDYYLDAFKKDEIISPSAKKMGLEVISKLRPDVNRVEVMAGAIDMAHHIVKRNPKKAYLAKWTSIFAKFSTFLSLYEESRDSKVAEAATLETALPATASDVT
jgi:hypothetical protein